MVDEAHNFKNLATFSKMNKMCIRDRSPVVFLENLVGIYKRLRAKGEYHMLEAMTYKEVDGLLYPCLLYTSRCV